MAMFWPSTKPAARSPITIAMSTRRKCGRLLAGMQSGRWNMDGEGSESGGNSAARNVEFRVMPSGEGRWYWEVIQAGRQVITRGVADTEAAACQEAGDAARKANLLP